MLRTPLVWRLGVWGCATGMSLLFARTTTFGPSVPISATHGVHVGDVVAFALA